MQLISVEDDVHLRLPTAHDSERLFALIQRNRDYLSRWQSWVPGTCQVGDIIAVIDRWRKLAEAGSSFNFLIEHENDLIGVLGVKRLEEPENLAELGYWLSEDAQGSGMMTKCCMSVMRWLFEEKSVNRVEIKTAAANMKSRAVPERLGFTFEGYLRDCTLIRGRYYDTAMYSLLAREWNPS